MGNYTELFFRAQINRDAPPELIDWFDMLATDDQHQVTAYDSHRFFDCERWMMALTGFDEVAFPLVGPSIQFTRGSVDSWDGPRLLVHSSFKHYDDEIAAFVDWITPFVNAEPGEFLGYSLYEDTDFDGQAPALIRMPVTASS